MITAFKFRMGLLFIFSWISYCLFAQPDPNFHIYLMFGQSNMEGAGAIEAQDRVTNPRVLMLQDSTCPNLNRVYGQWYVAAPPLNRCWGNLGPGDSFGRMMGAQAPDSITIGLVNASVSGCNIFIYKKGCPNGLDQASQGIPFGCGYTWLLDLAQKARQAGVIKGILFHQGETNNTDPDWKYTVQQIVADLKTDLGLDDIPFLAGELLYTQYGSCCGAHNTEINKLPGIIPNAHVISAAGLPGADYAHFTSASYRTLGERYARKMLDLVYDICDSTTIESWYRMGTGAEAKANPIVVGSGTTVILSPHPTNALGIWNWTGAGTSGSSREQTLTFPDKGDYQALVTYTNECGTDSRLPVTVSVCDSTPVEPWYKLGENEWLPGPEINVLKGTPLLLGPRAADTAGVWSWKGGGLTGSLAVQEMTTKYPGTYTIKAAYTNSCGAVSRLAYVLRVCDSTKIQSWYHTGGEPVKADSISVDQNSLLVLSPLPETETWEWTGLLTSGTSREQTINTTTPGYYTAYAVFTNSCGIPSRMTVKMRINPVTGISLNPENYGSLALYPNPSRYIVTLKTEALTAAGPVAGILTNPLGQEVMRFTIEKNVPEFSLPVDQLKPGIYIVNLQTFSGVHTGRFVRNL